MLSTSSFDRELRGRVITPGEPEYHTARQVAYGQFDRRPSLIVQAADDADVARTVLLAREQGIELAVRSGGHSPAGHSMTDGGIVLDVSGMDELRIDAEARTAWAQAGVTAGAYTTRAAEHGLATGFGDTGTVGLGGITLAGGIGYLVRKHGLTIDNLLAAEVVTADGELIRTDAETDPELFWAIRGGGGNFGVATRFLYRLHPVGEIVGGPLVLPATEDVIVGIVAAAEAAPEELSAIVNVMTAPPLPFLAPGIHGRPVVFATLAHAGDDGERALAPFKALATPLADLTGPMPYPGLFPPEADFRPRAASRTGFVEAIDHDAARTILDAIDAATGMVSAAQLRVLGGAMARVPADATAFAHRGERIMLTIASMYAQPEQDAAQEAWVRGLAEALLDGDRGAYVGFQAEDGPEAVRAAYPGPTYERLVAVKRRHDPDNLFRSNVNVPPA
jgi:FAD/FMN-containing dehydrogenase